jgi:uroporphyrinogen-III synthase
VIPLHGNVDTRLRRLDAGHADALLLAAAGLDRLGFGSRIAARLDAASMPPAPAQGALAVQTRRDDHGVLQAVGALDDPAIRMAVVAERALLKAMGGGCRAPVGAVAVTVGGSLALLVGAVTQDGRSKHVLRVAHRVNEADSLARAVSAAAHELKGFVPLRARAVIDTRPELDATERAAIEREGFRVLHVPAIAIGPAEKDSELDRIRARIGEYDWVVVTSKRGVTALFDGMQALPKSVRWAAVGATTAAALSERGVSVDCVPASSSGDAIPGAMAKVNSLKGSRVLLARADAASKALPAKLVEMGAAVDDVVAYRTVSGPEASRRALMAAIKDPDAEAIVFASGSAVRGIVELAGAKAGAARAMRAVTIGPKTSAVARELGFNVAGEAQTRDSVGLRAALRLVFDEEVERWVESQLMRPA